MLFVLTFVQPPFSDMPSSNGTTPCSASKLSLVWEKSILFCLVAPLLRKFGFWNSALYGNTKYFNTVLIPLQGQWPHDLSPTVALLLFTCLSR